MEIVTFAALTQNVIRDNGFDDFIPVACLPERREVRGLDGVDPGSNIEAKAIAWAASLVEKSEEFLVSFKISETQFKVVRRLNGQFESTIFEVQS